MPKIMEVIEYTDFNQNMMVKRMPDFGDFEVKFGAQLTVRESQCAIFMRDGQALDIFTAGRHVLKTQNIPLITKMVTKLGYGTDSPFRSEVYFLNLKVFSNLKWGTKEPILFNDSFFKKIRIRSFGMFSIQIEDPTLFLNKLVGTLGSFETSQIEDFLRNIIITRITDIYGENLESVSDMPRSFNELSFAAKTILANDFDSFGLKIHDFAISSISIPEHVQEMIDTKSGMEAVGDLDNFFKYKAALALEAAAENPGGGAAQGAGLGAGMGMGFMLPQMLMNQFGDSTSQQGSSQTSGSSSSSPMDKLKKLKELLDFGAISKEEFDNKKTKLLEEI